MTATPFGSSVLVNAGPLQRVALPLTMPDGAGVEASVFEPRNALATVVCLPALGVTASYYEPLALALAAKGVVAVTCDLRGLGTSTVRPRRGVDFGYAQLVEDTGVLLDTLRQRWPGPIVVLGHSLGGHVGALLAGVRRDAMDGLVLCACGTPYWRRFPPRTALGVFLLGQLTRTLSPLFGYFPGDRVGFAGREAAQLMREWSTLARRGQLAVRGLDAERALGHAGVRALVVSMEGDWMAPRAAVDHLAGKLSRASMRRVHLAAGAADPRGLDHFRWRSTRGTWSISSRRGRRTCCHDPPERRGVACLASAGPLVVARTGMRGLASAGAALGENGTHARAARRRRARTSPDG